MKIFNELNMSLALGFFDGVHLGHQAVIKNAVDYAHENELKSAVVTFVDHPCCYLWGVCPKYILMREDRLARLKMLGAQIIELDFKDVAHMTASEYLDFLQNKFAPAAIFTGFNHTFGTDKAGTEFLRENFVNYFEVPPVMLNDEIISSTEIRTALSTGQIEKANQMLGYNFFIRGMVVEGSKLGRELGFKTANVHYPSELIDLPFGVYEVKFGSHKAVANFGTRPTIGGTGVLLEVHILNFDRDIYAEEICVEFLRMLRPERKFDSLDELKKQIKKDIAQL